jgi:hypothetical protein
MLNPPAGLFSSSDKVRSTWFVPCEVPRPCLLVVWSRGPFDTELPIRLRSEGPLSVPPPSPCFTFFWGRGEPSVTVERLLDVEVDAECPPVVRNAGSAFVSLSVRRRRKSKSCDKEDGRAGSDERALLFIDLTGSDKMLVA